MRTTITARRLYLVVTADTARGPLLLANLLLLALLSLPVHAADTAPAQGAAAVHIQTVDAAGLTLAVDSVWWWFAARPQQRFKLPCQASSCSDWVLSTAAMMRQGSQGDINFKAYHSVPCPDDPSCQQLYSASLTLALPARAPLRLTLKYDTVACQ